MGPAECGQVAAHSQAVAEVAGKGTDVCAGGALHRDINVHDVSARFPVDCVNFETVDGDRARRELYLFTGADPCVGAFTVDLDGADAAGHLLDFTREGGHAVVNCFVGHGGGADGGNHVTFGVVGDGGLAQPNGCRVRLGRAHDVGQEPGGLVYAHHQDAGSHRIESAGVPHFPGPGETPHPTNHIMAGPSLRFVHYHQSRKHASQYIGAGDGAPPRGVVAARMASMPELAAHARDVPVNQIREITEAAWRTPGALVLSIGEPGFALPRHILEAGMACFDRDETNYTPNAGIPALREAFAASFRERCGVSNGKSTSNSTDNRSLGAERVYVVAGAQQGLHLAMSLLLSPGDEVLIPNPGYPTFAMTSRLLNAVSVGYPLYPEQDFQPRIRDIEALITDRTRVLVLNSPSNPLGAVLGEDLTRQLVELARKHDLWIISDECYEAFTYDVPHVSPARFDSDVPGEARVFTSLTLSKTYGMTGLRIGALVCPPGLEQKMNNVMEAIVSCVASPSQYAALAALTGPQDYVRNAHDHYRANRDAASAALDAKGIPYLNAQGAFYLWADVSHVSGGDVRGWARRFLADSGVALAPGTAFGSIGEGWVRIALCGIRDELVEGVSRLPERPIPPS